MKKSPRESSLGAQMSIVLQLMKRKNHHAIAKTGHKITMEQLAVLEVLYFYGAMNMTELSATVWKQNANITRIIDKLEKRKCVDRNQIKGDRRAYLISITKKGTAVFKEVIPIVKRNNKEVISCLSKKEEEHIINSLKKIIKHLI